MTLDQKSACFNKSWITESSGSAEVQLFIASPAMDGSYCVSHKSEPTHFSGLEIEHYSLTPPQCLQNKGPQCIRHSLPPSPALSFLQHSSGLFAGEKV